MSRVLCYLCNEEIPINNYPSHIVQCYNNLRQRHYNSIMNSDSNLSQPNSNLSLPIRRTILLSAYTTSNLFNTSDLVNRILENTRNRIHEYSSNRNHDNSTENETNSGENQGETQSGRDDGQLDFLGNDGQDGDDDGQEYNGNGDDQDNGGQDDDHDSNGQDAVDQDTRYFMDIDFDIDEETLMDGNGVQNEIEQVFTTYSNIINNSNNNIFDYFSAILAPFPSELSYSNVYNSIYNSSIGSNNTLINDSNINEIIYNRYNPLFNPTPSNGDNSLIENPLNSNSLNEFINILRNTTNSSNSSLNRTPILVLTSVSYSADDLLDQSIQDYNFNNILADLLGKVEVGFNDEDLDKVTSHIHNNKENKTEDRCPICLENFSDLKTEDLRMTKCGHLFCESCIFTWLKKHKKCPLCKIDLEDTFLKTL